MALHPGWPELPLFPLQTVLFPGGLLSMKVFEARYLDLMAACLREQRPFGVIALRAAATASPQPHEDGGALDIESTGVVAELIDVDSANAGILQVRCRGMQRFGVERSHRQDDGLWLATITPLPEDPALAPSASALGTVRGLANAIAALKARGAEPFLPPYRFDQAGWVANRWCEILPISLAAKQKLMELGDPGMRLQLVDEYLRNKGVV
jgi:Lon protease-like protein